MNAIQLGAIIFFGMITWFAFGTVAIWMWTVKIEGHLVKDDRAIEIISWLLCIVAGPLGWYVMAQHIKELIEKRRKNVHAP